MYIIGYETQIKNEDNADIRVFVELWRSEDFNTAKEFAEDIVVTGHPHSDKIITILEVVGNVSKSISAKVELRDKFVK